MALALCDMIEIDVRPGGSSCERNLPVHDKLDGGELPTLQARNASGWVNYDKHTRLSFELEFLLLP